MGYVSLGYNDLYDKDNVIDWGIFNVVNKDAFLQSNSRLTYPTYLVKLSALELISLRGYDDIDLYDLIVNSGML